MHNILLKNNWIEISDGWGFSYGLRKAGYFDERPVIHVYLTSFLSLLILLPVGIFFGLNWWYWVITLVGFLLGRFSTFIKLPIKTGIMNHDSAQWGIKYHSRGLWLHYGTQNYTKIDMPWEWVWVRTSALTFDSDPPEKEKWVHDERGNTHRFYEKEWEKVFWSRKAEYIYKRENGESQIVVATLQVREREWRWKWFVWLPFGPFKRVEKTISVEFSEPIGEGVDTFKGGVTGCGYSLKEKESPLDALRRMEANRKFKR